MRQSWIVLALLLILVGLAGRTGSLVALGAFLLLAGGAARLWANLSLERAGFERLLRERRAFVGERLSVWYRLSNQKLLPLPWIEVRERVPEKMAPLGSRLAPSAAPQEGFLTRSTHLRWYERASWPLELRCPERGYYRVGPARLRSGDPFGLFRREWDEPRGDHLVIFPRTMSLADLGLPAQRPFGERRGRERIFEDPGRIVGVRDYQPSDPLRRIDWKATARRGALQSRLYEPSTTQHLIVALNITTLERPWEGYDPRLLEGSIVVAASLARWAFEARYAVGLLANGSFPEADRPLKLAPGRAPDQFTRILEALAAIGPLTLYPLAAMLDEEVHAFPLGATLALVTGLMPEPLAASLRQLREAGHQVAVLSMADADWSEALGAIPVHAVGPYLRNWEESAS